MREIQLEGKVYRHTQYAIDAIAWATNRRGHNAWKSPNVVDEIYSYLLNNHVKMVTLNAKGDEPMHVGKTILRRALLRLAEGNLARIKHSENGRWITEFEFAADVILSGHSVNKVDPIDRLKESAAVNANTATAATATLVATGAPTLPEVPLPELPFLAYRGDEVTDLLTQWQKRDPEAHADYIDRLIDTLKVVVNG